MKLPVMLIATFALTACLAPDNQGAQVSQATKQDCFDVSVVHGFSSVDRDTVRLGTGANRKYDVDITGPLCDQIDWAQGIALESSPSSWICVGKEVSQGAIHFRDSATKRRLSCQITNVRRVEEKL